MRPLLAQCHLGLGRLYGKVGRPADAARHLAAATATFQAMGVAPAAWSVE
jgi:hypothetical protein